MAVATPTVVTLPHPLSAFGRVSTSEQFRAGETLGRFVARVGIPIPRSEYVVLCNGFEVPHASWRGLRPKPGDLINIAAVARGGGGSKVLSTVATLALALTAPYLAGMAMTGTWAVATGFTGSLLTMGIMIGGSLLISALIPPPKPTDIGTGSKYESSPTYSISGGRNRVRAWEPMTLIFGRHKVVPDAGAQPYVVNSGDDQYLNQVFHFGLQAGAVSLTNYKIGQTPIGNYQGVTLQQSDESGALSLFAGNVNTLQGFQLASGVINQRTTAAKVTYINVDLAATLFSVDDAGTMQPQTVVVQVQYAPAGSGAWQNAASYNQANYARNYWSLVSDVPSDKDYGPAYVTRQVSYGSVNPADHTDGEQVVWKPGYTAGFPADGTWWVPPIYATWRWMTHPYALGLPWQGIAPDPFLGTSTEPGVKITGAKQDATKTSVGWSVAPGQYDIRIWKATADLSDSRNHNDVAVTQILCYQQDTSDYSGQLRVALQIKANAQLNGAVDELSAIATAWAPVWDGSQFTLQRTRNPAWWFLWFAKGKVSGNRVYGAGLTNAQLDIEGIKAWAVFCDSKGLTFDYVLDQGQTCAQVLQMIARAGRASPTWQTGRLGVVWDAADRPVTAMFGPFNIKAGSFRIDYINGDTPDEIVANFADAANDWQMGEVRVKVPGATSTINPLQLDLEGVTDAAVAGREANLLAAAQIWHRRQVTWETDIEGWVAHRGDVVQISHDLTVWGYSGRVLSRDGGAITAVNEPTLAPAGQKLSLAYQAKPLIKGTVAALYQTDWQGRVALASAPRTNLVFPSTGFAAAWLSNGDSGWIDNYGVAPDGTKTTTLARSGGTRYKFVAVVPGVCINSYYARKAAGCACMLYSDSGLLYGAAYVEFDLETLQFRGPSGNLDDYGFDDLGAFVRVWMKFSVTSAGNVSQHVYSSSVGDIEAWGAEFTQDAPGVYIPTTTASVTVTDYVNNLDGTITLGQPPSGTYDWSGTGNLQSTLKLQTKLPTGNGTLMLRDPDGNMKTVAVTSAAGETDTVTLPDMTGFPLPGDAGYEDVPAVDWAWFFDPLETPGRRFRVTSVQPSEDGVKFTAVDDAPEYYASETNPYQYTPPRDGALLAGQIISFAIHEGSYNSLTGEAPVTIAWVLSARRSVTLTVSVGGTQRYAGDVEGTTFDLAGLHRGDVISAALQMRPAAGPVVTANTTYTVQGIAQPPEPVLSLTLAIDGARLALKWRKSPSADVVGYELRSADSGWGDDGALFRGDALSTSIPAPAPGVASNWYVRPYSAAGLYAETSATANLTLDAVPQVTGVTFSFFDTSETSATITLSWQPARPQLGLRGYRIEYAGQSVTADANSITLPANWIGGRTFVITTLDAAGNESAPAQISIVKLRPDPPTNLRANVIDNNVMMYWTLPEPTTLPVSHVHIKQGADWDSAAEIGTKKGSFDVLTETTPGQKTYWMRAVDTDGWESDPVSYSAVVDQPPDFKLNADQFSHFTGTLQNAVVEGGRVLARDVDVIATTRDTFAGDKISTQPGDVWHVHGTVNNVGSAFAARIGVYFIDATGAYFSAIAAATLPAGQSAELDGFVTAPAGAAQAQLWLQMDTFDAGTSQAVWTGVYGTDRRNARLIMPVNTDESWADHFGTRSWPTIQAQVDAGYPIYAQPTVAFSQYQEVFDFAQTFASSRVDIILDSQTVAGAITTLIEIETSADGVTYSDKQQTNQIFGTNFRFVRVTIKVIQDADDHGVYILRALECRLSTKLRNDAGSVVCNAADVQGTLANFNVEFVDVQSVTATAMGASPMLAVAAYKDAILDGTYSIIDGVVSASILNHEQIVGQAVRMAYANGLAEIVTITGVADANHFTAASVRPNKSGNVRAYSQGARYYLFDQSGVRQSGKVSWAVKGN